MGGSQPCGGSPRCVQARVLRALADHLERWPELAPVNISRGGTGWSLQVTGPPPDASAGLVAWTRSFGVSELWVRAIPEQVMAGFAVSLGGCRVEVWGCVDRLRDALGLGARGDTSIEVEEVARSWGGEWGG
jgi:hypothetical protein